MLTSRYVASAVLATPHRPKEQEVVVMDPYLTVGAAVADVPTGSAGHAGPGPWPLLTAMLVAALGALAAGMMHRQDGASVPKAVKRGGAAFVCATPLGLSVLLTAWSLPVTVVFLLAMIAALINGALDRADGASVRACLWQAAVAFTSLVAVGLGFLAVYGMSHPV
ncbi:hypothetical protein [Streptomyces sp. NPDC093071]|uniref:hypothetical protein n=1 Tax=Streptomyces sp. NPDC093071 TaxID=3366022 RepID=UPI003814C95B